MSEERAELPTRSADFDFWVHRGTRSALGSVRPSEIGTRSGGTRVSRGAHPGREKEMRKRSATLIGIAASQSKDGRTGHGKLPGCAGSPSMSAAIALPA